MGLHSLAALIAAFAIVHALHLRADFPNHSPWNDDWAKYTDEGWYGNAAIRAHLFGNWYMPGDFNPAPCRPVWPFLEWILFSFTGVSVSRGARPGRLFLLSQLVSAPISSARPRVALDGAACPHLIVTSPFLFSFSRLAILEPMLTAFTARRAQLAARLRTCAGLSARPRSLASSSP